MKNLLLQISGYTDIYRNIYKNIFKKTSTKAFSLPHIIISIMMITIFMIISFKKSDFSINLGDSLTTSIIADKEFSSVAHARPIETREELEKLREQKPLDFVFYRIRSGENLSSVAEKFGLSIATVLSLNTLDNAHSVSVGQKVLLSTRSGIIFNLTNNETIQNIAERYGISEQKIKIVNNLNSDHVNAGKTLFLPDANLSFKAMTELLGYQFINPMPRYRRVSSHFGWRRHPVLGYRKLHAGTDFAAPIGTPIRAAKEGRVIYADWNGSHGMFIQIRHNNGYTTSYSHLSQIKVKSGQWVESGEYIGASGNTGRSTGPHLHFELRKYGQPKNALFNGLKLK